MNNLCAPDKKTSGYHSPAFVSRRLRRALLCTVITILPVSAGSDSIRAIFIYGNKVTREKTIRLFMTVKEGERYDLAQAAASKKYLMESGLFTNVDLVANPTAAGVNLYVIVTEKTYWTLSDIGGETYPLLYGHNVRWFWWRARLGIAHTNVRGVMEEFDVRAAIWKARAFSVSWKKPFLGTPYFLKLVAAVDYRPDLRMTFDRMSMFQATTLGRRTGKRSLVYTSLMPEFEQKFWTGDDGWWRIDSSCGTAAPCVPESTWISNGAAIAAVEQRFTELYCAVGWVTDARDARFDTRSGAYFAASARTNALYPRRQNYSNAYVQFDTDTRLYHHGIFPGNTAAYRLRTTLRVDSAGRYDGLYAGGESTLRGYPLSCLPGTFVANNRILGTSEYRFPLFTTPSVTYPLLSQIHGGLKNFYYRVDGAFFFDAGYLWNYITEPARSHDTHVYGMGAGAAIRIMAPTLSHSICADFSWPVDKARRAYVRTYYLRPWLPEVYLYLDMYY